MYNVMKKLFASLLAQQNLAIIIMFLQIAADNWPPGN